MQVSLLSVIVLLSTYFISQVLTEMSVNSMNKTINLTKINKFSSLIRKKRFLVFPTNSGMRLSACLAKGGIILSPPAFIFTFDWDLVFSLPNDTSIHQRLNPAYQTQRRDRREAYSIMESLLERQEFDGRACVLRAVCEAQQMLAPGKFGLMEDIFHALFTLPQDTLKSEDDDLRDHDIAHRHGRSNQDCEALYSSCPVSLLNLALW